MLQEQKGAVRSIDIAVAMGYSKPSVSVAMKNLRENGYISVDGDGYIHLEEPGLAIARRIYDRHRQLTQFFVALGWTRKWPPMMPARSSTISARKPTAR